MRKDVFKKSMLYILSMSFWFGMGSSFHFSQKSNSDFNRLPAGKNSKKVQHGPFQGLIIHKREQTFVASFDYIDDASNEEIENETNVVETKVEEVEVPSSPDIVEAKSEVQSNEVEGSEMSEDVQSVEVAKVPGPMMDEDAPEAPYTGLSTKQELFNRATAGVSEVEDGGEPTSKEEPEESVLADPGSLEDTSVDVINGEEDSLPQKVGSEDPTDPSSEDDEKEVEEVVVDKDNLKDLKRKIAKLLKKKGVNPSKKKKEITKIAKLLLKDESEENDIKLKKEAKKLKKNFFEKDEKLSDYQEKGLNQLAKLLKKKKEETKEKNNDCFSCLFRNNEMIAYREAMMMSVGHNGMNMSHLNQYLLGQLGFGTGSIPLSTRMHNSMAYMQMGRLQTSAFQLPYMDTVNHMMRNNSALLGNQFERIGGENFRLGTHNVHLYPNAENVYNINGNQNELTQLLNSPISSYSLNQKMQEELNKAELMKKSELPTQIRGNVRFPLSEGFFNIN